MGFWSKLFKKQPKKEQNLKIADVMNAFYPSYSQFGDNIYVSDIVQINLSTIVNEMRKLDMTHVRTKNNLDVAQNSDIQRVLDYPNELMTSTEFLEKITWNYLLNYNAFVYPLYENDKLVALYPLQPANVEFLQDENNELYVKMRFNNGSCYTFKYKNIIHIRNRYSVCDYMGGDINGQPNNQPLLNTLKLNDTLLKGLAKSLNMQTSIQGVLKIRSMVNEEEQVERVKEFERKLKANESGILPIDNESEYVPIQKQIALLDTTTLEFIDKQICRWFGTSIPLINGVATAEEYEAFYQKTLEPMIKSYSQAFTKVLFSSRELGYDNKIRFYSKDLIFMNNNQKLQLFTLLSNQGGCFVNEIRTNFGLRPDAELDGVRCQSLNYVNANKADQYQVGEDSNSNEGENNNEQ